jgi:CheY-like chemotaxis protein
MERNDMPGNTLRPVIYLVDDEPLMLDYAEMCLKGLPSGCELKRFTNPAEALAAFAASPVKPALLVTDYSMGPIDGIELSERCKSEHPNLRIVMVSGTIDEKSARQAIVPLDGFLSKPYEPELLAQAVQAALPAGDREA